jgi:hypothetical protein
MGTVRLGVVDDHQAISAGVPVGLEGLVELAADSVQARTVDELLAADGEFERPRPLDQEFREFFAQVEELFDLVLERFEERYSTGRSWHVDHE